MKRILTLIGLFYSLTAMTQVTVETPAIMDDVVEAYAQLFPADEVVDGWSILVALNRDRRKIDEIKNEFKRRYPAYREKVEWVYENPYYKIIVGAFEDRTSALPSLAKIRKHYPGAFAVKNTFLREEIIEFRRNGPL